MKKCFCLTLSLLVVFMSAVINVRADNGNGGSEREAIKAKMIDSMQTKHSLYRGGLKLVSFNRTFLPHSKITIYRGKGVDENTGKVYEMSMDPEGRELNMEEALDQEEEAHDVRLAKLMVQTSGKSFDEALKKLRCSSHGKMSWNLFELLEKRDVEGKIRVAIWLKSFGQLRSHPQLRIPHQFSPVEKGDKEEFLYPLDRGVKSQDLKEEKGLEKGKIAERIQELKESQQDLDIEIKSLKEDNLDNLNRVVYDLQVNFLSRHGIPQRDLAYTSPIAPLVYVDLPKSRILEIIQQDDIDTIYGPNRNHDCMNVAKPTQKADIVDNWFGYDGSGIDLAIVEDSRVDFTNNFLNNGVTRVAGDSNVDNHATACAGMVASLHTTHQGIAQGANIFSANGTSYDDSDMSAAMDWAAVTQNVDIMNNSWGGNNYSDDLNQHDRHLDYIVRHNACTVVVAAGNSGSAAGHYVGSPAKAYNVITVGNYDDDGTLTWNDDTMSNSSSYNNPSTGCEKPEIAASGTSITSTLMGATSVGDAGSGTSYAAPMVSGAAAQLMERNSTLKTWPEAIKAILMATALNNIEGGSTLSSKDGSGGLDIRAAFKLVDEGWFDTRILYSSSFPVSYNIYAHKGETVRAVIAWDSKASSDFSTDTLEADLDVRIYKPDGSYLTGSFSSHNSYEIVSFYASETGDYELRINDHRFDGSSEYLGVAWWPGRRLLNTAIQTLNTPPISRDYFKVTPKYGYWNVMALRSPASSNYNIYMYDGSAFGDPDDYNLLEDSTLSSAKVDYVVIDRNHAPYGTYNIEARAVSGSGDYPIQWWSKPSTLSDGSYTFTFLPYFVAESFDVRFTAGTRKYMALKISSGDADFGMALHKSTYGTTSTYYQGRSNRVKEADATGAAGSEKMDYSTSTTDDLGLIIWNNGATDTSTIKLYVDSTAPTGSISINNGNASTYITRVTLNLSATDTETDVAEMRFANAGGLWSAWEPYSSSKSWSLSSGSGSKTVYVQFKNNAGQTSPTYSDSINYLPLIIVFNK